MGVNLNGFGHHITNDRSLFALSLDLIRPTPQPSALDQSGALWPPRVSLSPTRVPVNSPRGGIAPLSTP
jgi:hypothetical protein